MNIIIIMNPFKIPRLASGTPKIKFNLQKFIYPIFFFIYNAYKNLEMKFSHPAFFYLINLQFFSFVHQTVQYVLWNFCYSFDKILWIFQLPEKMFNNMDIIYLL